MRAFFAELPLLSPGLIHHEDIRDSLRPAFGIGWRHRLSANPKHAQKLRGGEVRFAAVASGEERTSQSDLFVMDVCFKPMRMISVELTDPKTGQKKLEFVWYIVYRAFNHKLETKGKENPPVNQLDPPVAPQQFIPEGTLMS